MLQVVALDSTAARDPLAKSALGRKSKRVSKQRHRDLETIQEASDNEDAEISEADTTEGSIADGTSSVSSASSYGFGSTANDPSQGRESCRGAGENTMWIADSEMDTSGDLLVNATGQPASLAGFVSWSHRSELAPPQYISPHFLPSCPWPFRPPPGLPPPQRPEFTASSRMPQLLSTMLSCQPNPYGCIYNQQQWWQPNHYECPHNQQQSREVNYNMPKPEHCKQPAKQTMSMSYKSQEQRTTLMLRNLPNDYTRDMLVDLLDSRGFSNRFDFVYLPCDFKRGCGLGYAFVNMATPADAIHVMGDLQGYDTWKVQSRKVLEVSWSKTLQGRAALIEKFRNSQVMHPEVLESFKPIILEYGRAVPFPASTRPIASPLPEKSSQC